jgi:phosphoribosylformylglycinamidine synthase
VSNGGLAVALAEMCMIGDVGASIDLRRLQNAKLEDDEFLFSESNSRFVVSTKKEEDLLKFFSRHRIPATKVGEVKGNRLEITTRNKHVSCTLEDMKQAYCKSIERLVE